MAEPRMEGSSTLTHDLNALLASCLAPELGADAQIRPPADKALRELQHHIVAFKRRIALLEGEAERMHERAWLAARGSA